MLDLQGGHIAGFSCHICIVGAACGCLMAQHAALLVLIAFSLLCLAQCCLLFVCDISCNIDSLMLSCAIAPDDRQCRDVRMIASISALLI